MTLRLAFYGDDFTGSTDALEVLAFAGLNTALFLRPPSAQDLARFGALDAFGVAGDSRAMSPAEMDAHLPAVFDALARSGAPLVHYKVCSTFDSAAAIGSIGRAMDLARAAFGPAAIPVVAGTPALQRYCLFGHLFARSATDDQVHRIDRHPIMRTHPVTPMDESDLRLHLGRQTTLAIANLAFPHFDAGRAAADTRWDQLVADGQQAVLLDSATPAHLTEVGRLLDRLASIEAPRFVVGSSGAEYGLVQWWRESRRLAAAARAYDAFAEVDRVLAVSGSASLLSARQVDAALAAGYADLAVDAARLLDDRTSAHETEALVARAVAALERGASVMLHSARGPQDPRIDAGIAVLQAQGLARDAARHASGRGLGQRLGEVARAVVQRTRVPRLLLSGGDTSSQVTQALAPQALVIAARLSRGAPLCRMVGGPPGVDGVEVALKGGQMGDTDFFESARRGRR